MVPLATNDPTLSDDLEDRKKFFKELSLHAARVRGNMEEVDARLDLAQQALRLAESDTEVLEQVTTLLQGLEAVWQKNFQTSVAKIISRGLTLVFEEPMEFKIVSKVRADVTTVDFRIVQGEGDEAIETDVMGAKGGTVVALVNVLVRALLILSARPALRRILILDEPFGLADDSYIPMFGLLLRELCDKLHFQIIVVSHEAALIDVADIAYEAYQTKRKGTGFRQIRSKNEVHA